MMEEGIEKHDGVEQTDREEIFSRSIRAGKRTYFFDVKSTRKNEYYLTVTESKKRYNKDGHFFYEKHKLFLYKEDFDKFLKNLQESMEFIRETRPEFMDDDQDQFNETDDYTNVEFEDLENVEASGPNTNEQA